MDDGHISDNYDGLDEEQPQTERPEEGKTAEHFRKAHEGWWKFINNNKIIN